MTRADVANRETTPSGGESSSDGTVAVLVNPLARRAGDPAWEAQVRERLTRRWTCEFAYPRSVEELVSAAEAAVKRRPAGVVAAGGDGTVGRVSQVLSGTGVPLGVIPLGNGNDFQRSLDLPMRPAAAADRIVEGRPRRLDLGEVNGRCFATIGVVGVPAAAALIVDRLTRPASRVRRLVQAAGSASYRVAGVVALAKASTSIARVRVAGSDGIWMAPREREAFGFCIANGRFFGAGLGLPVDGKMNDGMLDLCIIPAMPRTRLIWAFLCLVNGWRIPAWALEIVPITQAVIEYERPIEFSADGDRFFEGTRFDLRALPAALSMMC
jgi:diacylglycerol kinase (ATP)